MKIIWLMNHYAGGMLYNKGGRHYSFAKYLKKEGYQPVVFCGSNAKAEMDAVYSQVGKLGKEIFAKEFKVPFVFVKARGYVGNGIVRVLSMIEFYKNVKKVAMTYAKTNGKPDVILASSVHPLTMVAGIQLAKKLGVKCICEIRDLWPEAIFSFGKAKESSLLGKILIKGEHWIYRNADRLIFTKEGDTDYLKERKWTTEQGGDIDLKKCFYINNGVDLKDYLAKIDEEQLDDADLKDESKFNVVYAGSVRPVNNVGNLLDVAKIIKNMEGYEDVQFLIFGEGIELPKLCERVKEEQISNVKLKGRVEKKYIPYVLSKSAVNLLNYSQDKYNWTRGNSSNKLFEYMASGKPIVSTVHMGYSIIKKYNCGFELNENTAEELAKCIIQIHDMKKEQYQILSRNSRVGAEDFDFRILTQNLISVVESLEKNRM